MAERKILDALKMWYYRRMIKIKGLDRITIEKVLKKIREKRTLWANLNKGRSWIIGYTH